MDPNAIIMNCYRSVKPNSFGRLKQVSSAVTLVLILISVITVCVGLEQELSSACLNEECLDDSVSSPSQLIQLMHITEPLVEPDAAPNDTINDKSNRWKWKYIEEHKPGFEVLIRESSLDERLSNLVHVSKMARLQDIEVDIIDSGDAKLDIEYGEMVKGSKVDDVKCGIELEKMVSMLVELEQLIESKRKFNLETFNNINNNLSSFKMQDKHIRFATVLDSYGRYQSGSLSGLTYFLGAYEQCIGTQLQLDIETIPDQRTSTRYCVALLAIDKHLTATLRRSIQRDSSKNVSLHVGMCIPKSCHSDSLLKYKHLYEQLLYSQFEMPKSIFQDQKPELNSIFCYPDEDSQFMQIPLSGKLFIVTLIVWFALIGFFTYIGQAERRQQFDCQNWMTHFRNSLNLKRSWQDFILEDAKVNKIDKIQLDILNPIKVLGFVYVVWGHSIMGHLIATRDIITAYEKLQSDIFMTVNLNGPLVVDTFFVITGIFITFVTIRRLRKQIATKRMLQENGTDEIKSHVKNSLYLISTRYLRLVPLYFLIFWFKKSLLPFVGSGPLWDHGLNKATLDGSCKLESWSTPFTYLSAYKPLSRQCLPQAWSVANDLYFSIFLAPIVVLMAKRPKLASLIFIVIATASVATMLKAMETSQHELKADAADFKTHAIVQFLCDHSVLYTAAHHRVFSMIIGALAGCLLCHYGENSIKQWPQILKGAATKLSFAIMIATIAGPTLVPLYKEEPFFKAFPKPQGLLDHINSTFRAFWCISIAIIFIRMTTDWKDNYLMQNCAGKFWKIASKLNYAILLVHVDLLIIQVHLLTSMPNFSKMAMFSLFASSFVLAVCLSLILHVCIENPIDKLLRGYLDKLAIGTYTRDGAAPTQQEVEIPEKDIKNSTPATKL